MNRSLQLKLTSCTALVMSPYSHSISKLLGELENAWAIRDKARQALSTTLASCMETKGSATK